MITPAARPRPLARLVRGAAVVFAALALAVAPATAASADPDAGAAPAPVAAVGVPGSASGVDDFVFESFDVQYELGRDADARSRLHTTETLVAVFPPNQNRGIRRYIPSTYDGHPLQNDVLSVTDGDGNRRDYETSFESDDSGSYQVLTIALPEGQFTEGRQTYVIEYTQRDVTRFFEDTGDDEFYWDTNGTGWAQPFGEVTATVTLADGLEQNLIEGEACYYGPGGSTAQCTIERTDTGLAASVAELAPYENMTVVVAFDEGTFAEAPFDLFAWVPLGALLGLGASLLGSVLAVILRLTVMRGARGTGIVVAQYEPADDISPLLAANLVGKAKRGMAAAIVDLAVRRKIRIVERPNEGFFASGTSFGVQRIDETGLTPDDTKVMHALFATYSARFLGSILARTTTYSTPGIVTIGQAAPAPASTGVAPAPSEVRWLVKKDTALGQQVVAITKSVASDAKRRKLRSSPPFLPIAIVAALVIGGFLLLLFAGIGAQSEVGIVIGVFGAIISSWLGVGSLIMLGARRPLTKEGALAVEHLEGLREYIRLAEADRLQMLQSVTGAERSTTTGQPDVVKIYEKLLPYAVIFGLEKEWAGELAKYYDTDPPEWYDGTNVGAFNVGVFAASIGSLSSSVSTSYSGSASSSSSGGSGGGGSSGGGGGGGGGGGV